MTDALGADFVGHDRAVRATYMVWVSQTSHVIKLQHDICTRQGEEQDSYWGRGALQKGQSKYHP